MTETEVETLKKLLTKYFQHEFDFYKKAYNLVYGGNHLEDIEPESLFLKIIYDGSHFAEFLDFMESQIMNHIRYVFILDKERHRFEI